MDTTSQQLLFMCSNGFVYDVSVPTVNPVVDGGTGASDLDVAPRHDFEVGWDESPQTDVVGYSVCIRISTETCSSADYSELQEDPVVDGLDLGTLGFGETYTTCVVAEDIAGNRSSPACSDGAQIVGDSTDRSEVIETRTSYGLPTDAATIDEVLDDSISAVGTDYLAAEETALNDQLEDVDNLVETALVWGDDHPDSFAGIEVDHAAGGEVAVLLKDDADLGDIAALVPSEQVDRLSATEVPASQADLSAEVQDIEDAQTSLESRGIDVSEVLADPASGEISVVTAAGNEEQQESDVEQTVTAETVLNEMPDTDLPVEVVVERTSIQDYTHQADKNSIVKRRERVVAGAIYSTMEENDGKYSQFNCTTNATVKLGSSTRRYMLTAKHCLTGSKDSQSVSRLRKVRSSIWTYDPNAQDVFTEYRWAAAPFKGVARTDFKMAPKGTDLALIQMKSGWASKKIYLVWDKPNDVDLDLDIVGTANVAVGNKVEISAMHTKKTLGSRWDEGTVKKLETGQVVVKTLDVCQGDSGGPIYRETSVVNGKGDAKLVGVHVAHREPDRKIDDKWYAGGATVSCTYEDNSNSESVFVPWKMVKSTWSSISLI
jgi:hypothetical protein